MSPQIALSILGLLSIFAGLKKYSDEQTKDEGIAIIELVSFFRSVISTENEKLTRLVKEKYGDGHEFVFIKLDIPTTKHIKEYYGKDARIQADYLLDDTEIYDQCIRVLNCLEEFALRVKIYNAPMSDALDIVRFPYVELIESQAVIILMHRELISSGNVTYNNILDLYLHWIEYVDRAPSDERMKKFTAGLE